MGAGWLLADLAGGGIASVLSLAYCLSYAALVFSGPLAPWLPYGIVATFVSATVSAVVFAWRSSIPFAVAGPDSSTSAVIATLVAAFAARLGGDAGAGLLPGVILLMSLATGATGVLLGFVGFAKAGRMIRFVPYPVIGGFLGATGVLMMLGAVQVTADRSLSLATLASFTDGMAVAKIAAALAVALALRFLLARWSGAGAVVLPGVLAAAFLVTYAIVLGTGSGLAEAQAAGWMFGPQVRAAPAWPWQPAELAAFPWPLLPALAGDLLAVMFVTTISLLLNTSGIEIATRHEADIDRELRALGLANTASALLGGYVSCLSLSRTTLAHAAGASGRLTGITVAVVSAAVLVLDPALIGYVPKFALGGLLLLAGSGLAVRWLLVSARQLHLIEYLSLAAIALIIVVWGFVAGIVVGLVIGCATFAFSASRVNVIKFEFDGFEYRSSLDRSPADLALLAEHGAELQGIALQSYLFFGSANRLYERVKAILAERTRCRFLLFDFRRVTGVDSSATRSFGQIKQAAAKHAATVVMVGLSPELGRALAANGLDTGDFVILSDLDRALEWCEDAIVAAHQSAGGQDRSIVDWLAEALGNADFARRLAEQCARLDVPAGVEIAAQGDLSDAMYFILQGRVGVFVKTANGQLVRVRSLGRQTMVGETGLIAGQARSATIRAEENSVLYRLPIDLYRSMVAEQPALSQALFKLVIQVMAERLSFANRTIGALQR
jgi:SulP family sulfate permease